MVEKGKACVGKPTAADIRVPYALTTNRQLRQHARL
jgi:hypothetical protein